MKNLWPTRAPFTSPGYLWAMLLLIISGLLHTQSALAAINCQPSTVYPAINATSAINIPASYAGNDIPVGSTIYRNQVTSNGVAGVNCDAPFSVTFYYGIATEPLGPPTSMTGLVGFQNGSGLVYPTNVPGVGIAFWKAGNSFSAGAPLQGSTFDNGTAGDIGGSYTFDISLIKTGPIASGAVVNAGSFPTMKFYIPATPGYTGLPATVAMTNFSGSVNFITSTCTTPDVNVNMGSYDTMDHFSGAGSTTPWVDSSIQLSNCPTFSGYFDLNNYQVTTRTGAATGTTRTGNIFTVSLTPTTSVVDNANGVIALDTSGAPATGVGLQLGYTPNNLTAQATAPTTIWQSGASWDVPTPQDGRSNISIPLAARYFQTGSIVTPGTANTKVTFNIDYK
ncbi:type 1 fimbrial protein [Serratia proteamaculans]|uniref:fimbrial protein n=1 Tax=Serratia proteamaculans TaxID=28151 RepID=UPI001576C39C|nr:type 1 fimbrial protein [Serratia proteamaculans]NTX77443.1 type 1 fimbrial protein [Serratia proteamaculans]NTZ28314.1 type 1 fimbrial protein [Serratia proteamaculans]